MEKDEWCCCSGEVGSGEPAFLVTVGVGLYLTPSRINEVLRSIPGSVYHKNSSAIVPSSVLVTTLSSVISKTSFDWVDLLSCLTSVTMW